MSPSPQDEPDEVQDTPDADEWVGPPPYDADVVGVVAGQVQIVSIDLLGAYFEREDDGPLFEPLLQEATPNIGIGGIEWALSADRAALGCVVNFSATFEDSPDPYMLFARFRLLYDVVDQSIDEAHLEQFASWNVVWQAWPYWREYLSSTINRAQLPRFVLPVMGIPRNSAGD